MHFDTKNYLKSTHNHTVKHALRQTHQKVSEPTLQPPFLFEYICFCDQEIFLYIFNYFKLLLNFFYCFNMLC
jgi:hypothetical protein